MTADGGRQTPVPETDGAAHVQDAVLVESAQRMPRGLRVWIPRSGGSWAVLLLALGWGPLFLLEPLGALFPHLRDYYRLAGWGMAVGLGIGPICSLAAAGIGLCWLWQKLVGENVPSVRLDVQSDNSHPLPKLIPQHYR